MVGVVRGRDVARHPMIVVRAFGWRVFARCVWAALTRREATFLAVAVGWDARRAN